MPAFDPSDLPLILSLDSTLECRPGERGAWRWNLDNSGRGAVPLVQIWVQVELDHPDPSWSGRPIEVDRLEAGGLCYKAQGFQAPAVPGRYPLRVRLDCRDEDGAHLSYQSKNDLLLRIPAPEQAGGRLEIETGDAGGIYLDRVLKQAAVVRVKTGDVGRLQLSAADQDAPAASRLVEDNMDISRMIPVLLEPRTATDPRHLTAMDTATPHRRLLERLRAESGGGRVRIRKSNLQTRDLGAVGGGSGDAQTLRLGQTLDFDLDSDRPGYLTLLNIGTSGRAWLLVPNADCGPGQAQVAAGSRRLPDGRLLQCRIEEQGPPGWEHLAVMVSGRPLADAGTLARAEPAGPFYGLDPQAVAELLRRLEQERPPVDLISFRVIP